MPHTHILLKLNTSRTDSSIINWWKDEENHNAGIIINDYAYPMVIDYFVHRNQDSIDKGKYRYPEEDLRFFNTTYDDIMGNSNICLRILTDMEKGTNLFELARKYGKDFVYHYNQYAAIRSDMKAKVAAENEIKEYKETIDFFVRRDHFLTSLINNEITADELPFDIRDNLPLKYRQPDIFE